MRFLKRLFKLSLSSLVWLLAERELGTLAKKLIEQSCEKQGIQSSQLSIHSDRGPSMTSKPVAFLLADLGITKSLSRPYVSNDNPYSEAHFKTLKCRQRFRTTEHRYASNN